MISINKTTFIFTIIFLPLTLTSSESFDLGDPTIQAVCKITMMNDETFEGFITLGHGGYYGIWPNGF